MFYLYISWAIGPQIREEERFFPQRFSDCGPFCLPPPYDCQEARKWKQRRKLGNFPILSGVRNPLSCFLRWNIKGFAALFPLSTSWWSLQVSGCLESRLGCFGRKYRETPSVVWWYFEFSTSPPFCHHRVFFQSPQISASCILSRC